VTKSNNLDHCAIARDGRSNAARICFRSSSLNLIRIAPALSIV
jgi:hypothetical protein